jgi:hypothetical protein
MRVLVEMDDGFMDGGDLLMLHIHEGHTDKELVYCYGECKHKIAGQGVHHGFPAAGGRREAVLYYDAFCDELIEAEGRVGQTFFDAFTQVQTGHRPVVVQLFHDSAGSLPWVSSRHVQVFLKKLEKFAQLFVKIGLNNSKIKPRARPGANSLIKYQNHNHMKRSLG